MYIKAEGFGFAVCSCVQAYHYAQVNEANPGLVCLSGICRGHQVSTKSLYYSNMSDV